jgi:hypothetical protein
MPGVIYRALQKTTFDWSSIPASSSATKIDVAKALDVSAYREATLIVRIHSLTIVGAGSAPTLIVNAIPEAPTAEDPSLDFLDSTHQSSLTLNFTTSSTAPQLSEAYLSTPFGGWLRIQLNPTQSATVATTFRVTVSIDIDAKS